MKYIYLLFFITIIINHPILSQEIVESEGKIENAQILIEKNKIILLPDAQKKGEDSIQNINKIIKYDLNFNPLDLSLNKEKLSIDQINDYLINKKIINNYNNNFSVLYGNYKSLIINSNNYFDISNNLKFDASLYHNSNKIGYTKDENSGFFDSKILLNSYYTENLSNSNHNINLNLSYNRIKTFYYGFINENSQEISKEDIEIRNKFLEYNVSISKGINHDLKQKLNYKIDFNNFNFNSYLYNEYTSIIQAAILYDINQNIFTSLTFDNYYRNLKKSNNIILSENQKRNNMLLNYHVNYKLKNYDIRLGLIYDIDSKLKDYALYPFFAFDYSNQNGYSFNLFLDGGDDTNFYFSRIKENPYLFDTNFEYIDLVEKINFGGVFGIKLFKNKGNLKLSYNEKKVSNFFVYGKSKNDQIQSNNKNFDIYRYSIFYDSGDSNQKKIKLFFDYSKDKFFNTSLIFSYNNYKLNNFSYASNLPKYEIFISNKLKINDFEIIGNISSFIETYSIDSNNNSEKLESFLSLNVNINYLLFENTKIMLQLNNILDSKNEIYYNYNELGFNLKFGFTYSLK